MYQHPAFEETRIDVLHDLIRTFQFATLIVTTSNKIKANHLPLNLKTENSEKGILQGHIAKANPLWKYDNISSECLVIFQGPQAYITPSWYTSKQEHGKVVPTWNYAVVHARGKLKFIEDENWLREQITYLTDQNETQRPQPWAVTDAPEDFIKRQLRGIVGLEIEITELEGKWKMSQNKSENDRLGVFNGLRSDNSQDSHHVGEIIKDQM